MESKQRKKRVTIPAMLRGEPVRLMVQEHRPEERESIVTRVRELRVATPEHEARVIARGLPVQVVRLEELDEVG